MSYAGRTSRFILQAFMALSIGLVLGSNTSDATTIIGHVTDSTGIPIVGASVVATADGKLLEGSASDLDGIFRLNIADYAMNNLILNISSIGYHPQQTKIELTRDTVQFNFMLSEKILEMSSITVVPTKKINAGKQIISNSEIFQSSQYSLVPTNPTSALKQPSITRVGSNHSSKIRVNGTSPRYYLNGISIGKDPNHYGAFSIIPASVVEKISFYPRGTSARFGLPTVIEMKTPQTFETPLKGDLNLSFIELTSTASIGNNRFYTLAAIRKSVLDVLVDHIEIESDRSTLPPTNFQDIFISSGVRLSNKFTLTLDQFHIRDFLDYGMAPNTTTPKKYSTFQHTQKNYWGLQLGGVTGNLLVKLRAAANISQEKYIADSGSDDGLFVNLYGSKKSAIFSGDFQLFTDQTIWRWGGEVEYIKNRQIELQQNNWNFLPPDVTSDNPYLYQQELNKLYGYYSLNETGMRGASYLTLKYQIGSFEVEPGVRLEYFRGLVRPMVVTLRQSVRYKIDDSRSLNLFAGSYADSPTGEILEPYQVLIYDNQRLLKPVNTILASLGYDHGPFSVNIYYKRIKDLPITIQNYSRVDKSDMVLDGFVSVASHGRLYFKGIEFSFDKENIASGLIDFYGFYSYSSAYKLDGSFSVPYDLDATHNFYNQIRYKASSSWSLTGALVVRSGYSYTPTFSPQMLSTTDRYDKEFYDSVMVVENSRRFPTHISFNLGSEIRVGKTILFMALSNITNHDNAIINTRGGYVYDTGILPSVGIRHSF